MTTPPHGASWSAQWQADQLKIAKRHAANAKERPMQKPKTDPQFAGPWIAGGHQLRHLDRINGNDLGVCNRIVTALRTEASERALWVSVGAGGAMVAYIIWGVLAAAISGGA